VRRSTYPSGILTLSCCPTQRKKRKRRNRGKIRSQKRRTKKMMKRQFRQLPRLSREEQSRHLIFSLQPRRKTFSIIQRRALLKSKR
jgi:hypothetical protein